VEHLLSSTHSMRCDYCREPFGVIVHRYWRMRFCSGDCLKAYQCRLDKLTMIRIGRLDPDARLQMET
jgi:hypothetical protein